MKTNKGINEVEIIMHKDYEEIIEADFKLFDDFKR